MRTPLPVDDLPVGCGISAAEFAALTCYCNASDNGPDDERRARLLGFGNGVKVAPGAIIRIGDNEIGENSFIGLYAYLNGDVRIGRNVLIGPHCSLPAGNHRFDPATQAFTRRDLARPITVGDGTWLGSGCTVTNGGAVGRCNLICANAVITRDTPDYAIMAGTPARQIGRIDPETGDYIWFDRKTEESR